MAECQEQVRSGGYRKSSCFPADQQVATPNGLEQRYVKPKTMVHVPFFSLEWRTNCDLRMCYVMRVIPAPKGAGSICEHMYSNQI